MAVRPTVQSITEDLYSRLGPWAARDTFDAEWPLLDVAEAIGQQLQPVEDIIRDTDTHVGWGVVMDVDEAPSDWLGWLAQFGGVRLKNGLTDLAQRARVKSTDGMNRGTPSAVVGAAQQTLTGTKTVYLVERHGSAYRLTVTTIATETPSAAQVIADLIEQKPAGIVLAHAMTTGSNYNALRDTHADYAEVKSLYSNYTEVLSNPVKQ
jgi:hypothetical protein